MRYMRWLVPQTVGRISEA